MEACWKGLYDMLDLFDSQLIDFDGSNDIYERRISAISKRRALGNFSQLKLA